MTDEERARACVDALRSNGTWDDDVDTIVELIASIRAEAGVRRESAIPPHVEAINRKAENAVRYTTAEGVTVNVVNSADLNAMDRALEAARAVCEKEAFRSGWQAALDFSEHGHDDFEKAWTAHSSSAGQGGGESR